MNIVIREATALDLGGQIHMDGSFIVDSELALSMTDQKISYQIRKIPSYRKSYLEDAMDEDVDANYSEYIDNPDQIIYLAFAGEQAIGQIILKRNWNKYAYIEDILVDNNFRRYGIGRRLIEQAVCWAKAGGMPGIMLETQSNNVKACQFYESCGFVIGGFDSYLYKGLDQQTDETALYWYLLFD